MAQLPACRFPPPDPTLDGTQVLPFAPEKNFAGMYTAFARALDTGDLGDLASGEDGIEAIRLSRQATDRVMRRRPPRSS